MDSVTYGAIMIAAFFAAPVVFRAAVHLAVSIKKKRDKKKKIEHKKRMKTDKEYQKEYLKKQKLQQAISKKNNVTFKSPTTGRTLDVPLETDYAREELKEQEIIIKGTIRCKCSDGIIRGETIYLYQPILRTSKGKRVGPIITNGALNADAPYQANYEGDQFVAHIPKREVVSQLNFDFIRGSKNHQNPEIRGYMDIEVPKDKNGNYIPVDFTDPKELQEFKEYVARHKKHDAANYFGNIYGEAVEAKKELGSKEAEPFDISKVTGTTAVKEEVEKQKPKEETKTDYSFYDRYNYHRPGWMGERGTDYAQNFDIADHIVGEGPARKH